MTTIHRRYRVEPTFQRFHADNAKFRAVMGPIGSGKTVGCLQDLAIYRSQRQAPNRNGVRKTRFAIIRNTYPELKTTTLKTWKDWYPESVCPVIHGSPVTTELRFKCPDGTEVASELWFLALDRPSDVAKLLSMELTGAYLNEVREVDISIVQAVFSRTGRYPRKDDAPFTWRGILMDTNPCDSDHWYYRLAEEDRPEGWSFYRQPPALAKAHGKWAPNPAAENVRNLGPGYDYWLDNVRPDNEAWVKVYCAGEYGFVQDGQPVYPAYSDALHYMDGPIPFEPRLPLMVGFDFGLTPACIFAQYYPAHHRVAWLKELISEDMGINQFLDYSVVPEIGRRFPAITDFSEIIVTGDPAGNIRAQTDEKTCYDSLRARGFGPEPAVTNELVPRIESMNGFLTKTANGRACCLLSSEVPVFRKGLAGKYRFKRVKVSGEERYHDQPVKDLYSHVQDAGQYVTLKAQGGVAPKRKKEHNEKWGRMPRNGAM